MTTYFAWRGEKESFNRSVHERSDLDIFELTIDHREGEVALATIVVARFEMPSINKRYVYISHEGMVIFSGRLAAFPLKISHELVSLEFTAEPPNAVEQLQALESGLKVSPFWDPFFVDARETGNPAEWLEARSALFTWDRVTGIACLSDLFSGRQTLEITDLFFEDSLKVALAEAPITEITVTVTAQWIQEAEGEVNVGPKIGAAFPGGLINTLTPEALQTTWPQEGQKLGRSGFWVVKSLLKKTTPPKTGILNIYPTVTPEFWIWDEGKQAPKQQRAQRFWMLGTLVLGWRYRQKRRETVRLILKNNTQMGGMNPPRTRALNLRLQEIGSSSASSFFLTHRGRQAIDHALERAKAHLAASVRCLEVEALLPFDQGLILSMDHSIILKDPRIPGGEVSGKVIQYQLYQDGTKAYAWVRFAASIGAEAMVPVVEHTLYADAMYGDMAIPQSYVTVSGIAYTDYANQRPTKGIIDLGVLSVHELLRGVSVTHDAERQIQYLQSQQYPTRQNLKGALEEVSTTVSLNLLSLKTFGTADHQIELEIKNAWAGPMQVMLTGRVQ